MSLQRKREVYSDITVNFDSHPMSDDLAKLVNEDAVTRSIKNILFTKKFERFTDPEFGVGVEGFLFENFSNITEEGLMNEIELAIRNYEPRADLIEVKVKYYHDENQLEITIKYGMIAVAQPVVFKVLLTRIR